MAAIPYPDPARRLRRPPCSRARCPAPSHPPPGCRFHTAVPRRDRALRRRRPGSIDGRSAAATSCRLPRRRAAQLERQSGMTDPDRRRTMPIAQRQRHRDRLPHRRRRRGDDRHGQRPRRREGDAGATRWPTCSAPATGCCTFDNRGVGKTEHAARARTPAACSRRTRRRSSTSWASAASTWSARSMGGMIAQEYAIAYGARPEVASTLRAPRTRRRGRSAGRMFAMWADMAPVNGRRRSSCAT